MLHVHAEFYARDLIVGVDSFGPGDKVKNGNFETRLKHEKVELFVNCS